jgi:hypothetical protein
LNFVKGSEVKGSEVSPSFRGGCAQVYFASAMESGDFEAAMSVLDPLERTPDTEGQWQQLAEAALQAVINSEPGRALPLLVVAERGYAATGNIARASYLRKVVEEYARGLQGDQMALSRAEVSASNL